MHLVRALDDALSGELARRWHDWRDRYLPPLQRLLEGLRGEATRKSHRTSLAIAAIVDPFLPAERRPETLARKALWVLASTPAVTVVLNGMRRSTYVDDAVSVLRWSPLPDAAAIYRALRDWRGAA
jgi:aryl-alcohol dehydrogenase-like predicted oxidoreductase